MDDGSVLTFKNNFWWFGDIAYTRAREALPQTWSWYNGCLVANQRSYYWRYTRVPVVVKKVVQKKVAQVPAYAPGWRTQLLEIAKKRDATESQILMIDLDHKAYLETVNAAWSFYRVISRMGKKIWEAAPVAPMGTKHTTKCKFIDISYSKPAMQR